MRIKSISADNADIPNKLIQSCPDAETKRSVLAKLRVYWRKYEKILAIYDSNENIIGIAFADNDGNIAEIASPYNLVSIMPVLSQALQDKIRKQNESANAKPALRRPSSNRQNAISDSGRINIENPQGHFQHIESNAQSAMNPVPAKKKEKKRHPVLVAILLVLLLGIVAVCTMTALKIGPFSDMGNLFDNRIVSTLSGLQSTVSGNQDSQYQQIADNQTTTITISDGDTIQTVIQELRTAGMPDIATDVYKIMEQNNTLSQLQTGTYALKGSEDAETVARRLASGQFYPDGYLGIDNGTTLNTMISKIDKGTFNFTSSDFKNAFSNPQTYKAQYKMLAAIPDNLPSLEGFVPAGVYDVSGCQTADDAVKVLLNAGEQRFETSGMDAAAWFRTLTIASMIDKEIIYDSERPIVASVINNRLAQNMPLQIDATVLYALGRDTGIPTFDDLKVDSPYNTYKNTGLPIGPICSGISQSSIDAVINPANTDYLYYVLAPANDGHHVFTNSYDEHQKNVQAYNEATGRSTNS